MGCAPSKVTPTFTVPERVEFSHESDRTARCSATVSLSEKREELENGIYQLTVDNGGGVFKAAGHELASGMKSDGPFELTLDADTRRQRRVVARVGPTFTYEQGARLLLLHKGRLQDAIVKRKLRASTHELLLQAEGSRAQPVALNQYNHVLQRFESAAAYEAARTDYCARLASKLAVIEDAITGNMLDLQTQTIRVSAEARGAKATDGAKGVRRAVETMPDLLEPLLLPAPERKHGTVPEQDVIIRAEAGTGKTFGLNQLTLLLATSLQTPNDAVPLVPLLLPVQRLAVLMRQAELDTQPDDLIRFFIEREYSGADQQLLLMAYEMRALIPLIDGVDEGADLKQTIETFIVKQLSPSGLRTGTRHHPMHRVDSTGRTAGLLCSPLLVD